MLLRDFFGFVRMNADAGVNPVVFARRTGWQRRAFPGPGPVPIARSVPTPAARARSSMASRSSANCGKSMCAWESMRSIYLIALPSKAARLGASRLVRSCRSDLPRIA